MRLIRSRAPLRLGLSGGGTDVSPYCDIYGGFVLNASVDRYAYAITETHEKKEICFVATDQSKQETYSCGETISLNKGLCLHNAVYKFFIDNYNFNKPIP